MPVPQAANSYSTQLIQEPKPIMQQFVIQRQPPVTPRPGLPITQPLTHQPQVCQGLSSPPITSQASLEPPSSSVESNTQRPSNILPLIQCPSLCSQDGAVQRRLLPPSSAVILHIPNTPALTNPMPNRLHKHGNFSETHLPPSAQIPATVPLTHTSECHRAMLHDSSLPGLTAVPNSSPPLDMTSGNGSSPLPAAATGSTAQNGENKPPQAVVKPQILTHVIEGFVIQEGAQPFPSHRSRAAAIEVGRTSLLVGAKEKCQQGLMAEKLPQQDNTTTTTDSELEEPSVPEPKTDGDLPKLKCELCGRVDLEYKFKRSKRFCSMACAKRYNVGCSKRVGLFHPDRNKLQKPGVPKLTRKSRKGSIPNLNTDSMKQGSGSITPTSPAPLSASSTLKHTNSQEDSSRCSDNSSYEEPLSPVSASSSLSRQRTNDRDLDLPRLHPADPLHTNHNFLPSDPTKWNVEDVYKFIRSLPGCQDISEEFRAQEIDGQALLLLKEDHLMSAMNIKLGPALKIYARITMLKDS
ncbi:polyhomeotic-like protein 2 isoform X2 [Hyperolius riggenbachi]|uniref:polyhomeotic-like protein 2 isoform X2 n=1 Tax=Hyperolius riggenbachi TaxID=752182 RepID=UPI0035A2F3F9